MTHTFTIPLRLPRLNAFNRMHWAQKKRLVDSWRGSVSLFCGAKTFEGAVNIRLIQQVAKGEVRVDPANLIAICDKLIIDALVKRGVLVNDSPKYIRGFETAYERGDKSAIRIEITTAPTGMLGDAQGSRDAVK